MPITLKCSYCGKNFTAKPYVASRPRPCCSNSCKDAIRRTDPIKRFLDKIDKRNKDACWNWLGYKDKDGYGTFNPTSKTLQKAHRFAYALEHGEIPRGMCVCHKCDNPSCCNPQHLFLGTPADNDADRDQKNRHALGEKTKKTNFTKNDILNIRKLYDEGMSESSIARLIGASQTGIGSIVRRRTWKHI